MQAGTARTQHCGGLTAYLSRSKQQASTEKEPPLATRGAPCPENTAQTKPGALKITTHPARSRLISEEIG